WCVECGWDGLEDELMFTNEGVFVCPQCGGEDTDYFYSEDASNCVFCGSHDVVGVIDIVSLNEIHEATPLDQEQVYGYCARCADVKMAEGSTGDQIVSWEDGAGVSSPSMPPSDIKWAESKKDRIASGRAMHYAIPSEKKYPIWDKAHARMALAWSQGTKYADKVEKAVTKRFPTMNAETVYRNYPGRKGPSLSATSVKRGTRKRGNDGNMWEVRKSGKSQRWFRGAESFEGETLMGNWVDGRKSPGMPKGKFPKKNLSYGELLKFVQKMVIQGHEDYIINMYVKVKDHFDDPDYLEEWTVGNLGVDQGFELSVYPDEALIHEAESFEALGEPDAPYDQGYDDQQDESLGERNVTTGEQSLKDRRDEADAMDKKTGRKYHDVGTMDRQPWNTDVDPKSRLVPESIRPGMVLDSEHHKGQGYDDEMDESLGMRNRVTGEQSFKDRRDEASAMDKGHTRMGRKYDDVAAMDSEHHKGQGYDDELDESLGMSHKESGMKQSFK
ncbi:MAG: hypothetical protein KAS36_00250, partial [Anaerolineales bacterium]|nr:hypothetical protein [Anaerolineales bacterium]